MKSMMQTIAKTILSIAALSFALAAFSSGPVCAQTTAPSAARLLGAGGNDTGFDMAPETRLEVVQAAVSAIPEKLPAGPVQPTWDSLKASYKVPKDVHLFLELPRNALGKVVKPELMETWTCSAV